MDPTAVFRLNNHNPYTIPDIREKATHHNEFERKKFFPDE